MKLSRLCGFLFQVDPFSSNNDRVKVDLECGSLVGTKTLTEHGPVNEFHRVPFAVPPIGTFRWTHSKLLTGPGCWDGALDATPGPSIMCVQAWEKSSPVSGQEDCLHLTVRTPDINPKIPFPVLVWIHGGSLKSGHSELPGYAPDNEFTGDLQVVTVNINYRLDVFGFLSSPDIWEDPDNPGNYGNFGIGDAITALRWVQENISMFGGDPESVTILGESSGGTIVQGLLASEQADGLFHRAISLSAPPIWKASPESACWNEFADRVGCFQQSVEERRQCLKKAPISSLIYSTDLDRGWGFYDFPYADGLKGESMDYSVIDKNIVKSEPLQLGKQRRKQKVKVIISNTAQEIGANAVNYGKNKVHSWQGARNLVTRRVKNLADEKPGHKLSSFGLVERILHKYDFQKDSKDWWPQIFFDTLTTDIRTTCLNNDLVAELNKSPDIDAYRLYIKSRPEDVIWGDDVIGYAVDDGVDDVIGDVVDDVLVGDEVGDVVDASIGIPWSCIHGWDTEALFNYGYYGPHMNNATIANIHQRKFRDNIRQLVADFCYDRDIEGWDPSTAMTIENEDFPFPIALSKDPPQKEKCKMWREEGMLQFGWQN